MSTSEKSDLYPPVLRPDHTTSFKFAQSKRMADPDTLTTLYTSTAEPHGSGYKLLD